VARLQVFALQKPNYLEQVFTGGKVELISTYLLSKRRGFAAESIIKLSCLVFALCISKQLALDHFFRNCFYQLPVFSLGLQGTFGKTGDAHGVL